MPSTHQHGGSKPKFTDEHKRMMAMKDRSTIEALIRGIEDADRALAYAQAEYDLASAQGREPRQGLLDQLTSRLDALQNA